MLGSNRYAVYFASPLTNGYGECYSGGNLTPQFAKTGYKVVIVEGKADAPVYLEISEQGAQFHDASDLWGMDAFKAEDEILARTPHKKAQACVIGPAGEKLVKFACVNNNYWHQLGRGGPGAVYGSKNLKGLVWHGEKKVEVARPDDFKAVVRDLIDRCKDDPGVAAYQRGGTLNMVRIMNGVNAFPTRYWRKGKLENFERITVETMLAEHGTVNQTCPPVRVQVRQAQHGVRGSPQGSRRARVPSTRPPTCSAASARSTTSPRSCGSTTSATGSASTPWTPATSRRSASSAPSAGSSTTSSTWNDPEGVGAFLEKICLREGIGDLFAEGALRSPRSSGSRTWWCTPRAWRRPATSRAR